MKNFEYQNPIFRPWAPMPIQPLELTDTFNRELKSNSCDSSNSIITQSIELDKTNDLSEIKPIKFATDADRLKRMLSNEKMNKQSNGLKKSGDKKILFKKLSSEWLKTQQINGLNQQNQSNIQTNGKTNSPASSSAETRLINSRIAALSSASHLLSLETYGRLTTPINNLITNPINNQIAAMAAAAVNQTTGNQMPLNFGLANSLPNSLSIPTNLPHQNTDNSFNLTADKCILSEIDNLKIENSLTNPILQPIVHPSVHSNVHSISNNLTNIVPNSLPNCLSQSNLTPLNSSLPQIINNISLPNQQIVQSTNSISNTVYNEMINTLPLPQSNLINPINTINPISPQLPSSNLPSTLIKNNCQFPTNNLLPSQTDFLMVSFKKSHLVQQSKKNRPKKFHCNRCPANFANNGQLKGHYRTHTGERPFACDFENCNKRFTRNEELTRHKKIHSGEKPFSCPTCLKRFGRKDHLKKHIRTHERAAAPHLPFFPIYFLN